ncbi:MmpS family transport accessory protein [Mycobacterium sp. WMMD1722]|uniref:MmpS family transport accessory protein n=1 Tax=Mycobacterium sp. WMMD1722 TaxID=3404117 RepID=UPI003BF57645
MSRPYPPHPELPTRTERLERRESGSSPYGAFGDYRTYDSYRRSGRDHGSSYQDYSVRTRTRGHRDHPGYADPGDRDPYGHRDEYQDDDYEDGDYEDYDAYVGGSYTDVDRRWLWIAGMAGAILLVAVVCTTVILGGGDSGSVSATVQGAGASPAQMTPAAPAADPDTSARPAPPARLSPETVTTVTPTPRTPAPSATLAPEPLPTAAAAPVPLADPRTITYTVAGNKQLIDLVTVIYTDQQGALQTELNVALPWSKTVTLDPGVQLKSVTATSVGGQLTCAITDTAGTTLVAQTNPSMLATCTQ